MNAALSWRVIEQPYTVASTYQQWRKVTEFCVVKTFLRIDLSPNPTSDQWQLFLAQLRVPRRQPHRRSGLALATLPSVGAVP